MCFSFSFSFFFYVVTAGAQVWAQTQGQRWSFLRNNHLVSLKWKLLLARWRASGLRLQGCKSRLSRETRSGFVTTLANSKQRNITMREAAHSLKNLLIWLLILSFSLTNNDKKKLFFQHIYINLMRLGVCAFKGQHSSFDILTKQQNVVKSLEWIHLHSQVGSPHLEWEIIIYKGTSRKRVFIFWVPTYICLFYMKFYFTLMDEWGL